MRGRPTGRCRAGSFWSIFLSEIDAPMVFITFGGNFRVSSSILDPLGVAERGIGCLQRQVDLAVPFRVGVGNCSYWRRSEMQSERTKWVGVRLK